MVEEWSIDHVHKLDILFFIKLKQQWTILGSVVLQFCYQNSSWKFSRAVLLVFHYENNPGNLDGLFCCCSVMKTAPRNLQGPFCCCSAMKTAPGNLQMLVCCCSWGTNDVFGSLCNRCKYLRVLVDTKTPADFKWLPWIGNWICSGKYLFTFYLSLCFHISSYY